MDEDKITGGVVLAFCVTIGLGLVAAVVFIGWQVGWWFQTQNTNRTSHLYEHEYGHQSSLIDDIGSKQATLAEITVQLGDAKGDPDQTAALTSQRLGVANIICADSAQLNGHFDGLSADQRHFVTVNCDGATVKPTSSLRNH